MITVSGTYNLKVIVFVAVIY